MQNTHFEAQYIICSCYIRYSLCNLSNAQHNFMHISTKKKCVYENAWYVSYLLKCFDVKTLC